LWNEDRCFNSLRHGSSSSFVVLEMASSGSKPSNVSNKESADNATLARYADMLVRSGFVRTVSTQEGISYEITESGSRFLKEYQDMQRDVTRRNPHIREPS